MLPDQLRLVHPTLSATAHTWICPHTAARHHHPAIMQCPPREQPSQPSSQPEGAQAVVSRAEGAEAGAPQAADAGQLCRECSLGAAAEGEPDFDEEEYDPEMGLYLVRTLQKILPGAELTMGSIKILTTLLDGLTQRILEEAKQVSFGAGETCTTGDAKPLTSLDIHKALKRVLPGDPGETLRPYLPAVTKQAWHLDKQSLKGVKRLKTGGRGERASGGSSAAKETSAAAAGCGPQQE